MANFSLNDFISKVTSTDLARPNKFEVIIPVPAGITYLKNYGETVSLFCESSSFPAQTIFVKQHRIFGAPYPRPVTSDFGGGGMPMSFYVDQKMDVKAFFDVWLFNIVNPNSFLVEYKDNYVSQIEVKQLNNKMEPVYSIKLIDAFPQSVNLLDLNMATQNQVHKVLVNFAYRKWVPTHTVVNQYNSSRELSL